MSGKEKYISQQPQLLKTLENLLKLPENRECVDCGTKAPRWASTNLGVFVCIRCSGIHRKLGVHISKVKSVSLDTWSPEQVEFMEKMGNAKGKEIYEAYVPSTYNKGDIMNEAIALEQWIRDKYDRKRFMSRDGAEPTTHKEYKEQKGRSSHRESHRDTGRESHRDTGRESHRDTGRDSHTHRDNDRGVSREAPRDRDQGRDARESSSRPAQAPQREIRAPVTSSKQPTPAPVAAPVQESYDLLNWDEPVRTPQQAAQTNAPAQNNDFFGEFTSAASASTITNVAAAPPQKDKNDILRLYNAPPMVPAYGMPHVMHAPVYPTANYNVHLQGNPGYPPNMYMNGAPANYNMGMGRGMATPYNMGPMGGVPPNYYNNTGYTAPPYGGHGQPGYTNYAANPGNPNNLVNGMNNLNLRM